MIKNLLKGLGLLAIFYVGILTINGFLEKVITNIK